MQVYGVDLDLVQTGYGGLWLFRVTFIESSTNPKDLPLVIPFISPRVPPDLQWNRGVPKVPREPCIARLRNVV